MVAEPKAANLTRTEAQHDGYKGIYLKNAAPELKPYSAWFRSGPAQKMPRAEDMVDHTTVREKIIKGWEPSEPFINRDTRVTAFGSCFAANISGYLGQRGYSVSSDKKDETNAYVVHIGEGMVNSFVIRQQFEWAWENETDDVNLWYAQSPTPLEYDEDIRLQTKELFDNTDVFILTFGLSEVWYDIETNGVFLRPLPRSVFDPERHSFRVSTIEENRENIDRIYELVRKHAPHAKIIMTLSPIPLILTFREQSCITSNSVSKGILRVAIDEVVRKHKDDGVLHYWPSYEIIKEVFPNSFVADGRHIDEEVLKFVMTQFEYVCCDPGDREVPDLRRQWLLALIKSGRLPGSLLGPIQNDAPHRLLRTLRAAGRLHHLDTVHDAMFQFVEAAAKDMIKIKRATRKEA